MSKTIEDIAKQAGVSKTTVSMVMNGRGSEYRISKQTQRKILDIVKEENYTLDQYARGFRLKKTQTIGLIVPDLTNWFFLRSPMKLSLLPENSIIRFWLLAQMIMKKLSMRS